MKWLKRWAAVCLLVSVFACTPAIKAEVAEEEWMPYVFSLQSNALDWSRITRPDNFDRWTVEMIIKEEGRDYTYDEITLDYSKAYAIYSCEIERIGAMQSSWEKKTETFTVDGIPQMTHREVGVPMYVEGKLIGIALLGDWTNGLLDHMTPPPSGAELTNGGQSFGLADETGGWLIFTDEPGWESDWKYAPEAYEAAKDMGLKIRNIVVTYGPVCYIVTDNDDEYDLYVYDALGEKIYTFGRFSQMCADGSYSLSTSKPTPNPTPAPTVSRTPFQSMTTLPTVTPRPSGTGIAPRPTASAGSGTETAAVSPTASPTVPGPKKAELTWLIPVIVLGGAAAGGIAWAAIAAGKRKKDK